MSFVRRFSVVKIIKCQDCKSYFAGITQEVLQRIYLLLALLSPLLSLDRILELIGKVGLDKVRLYVLSDADYVRYSVL